MVVTSSQVQELSPVSAGKIGWDKDNWEQSKTKPVK